MYIYAFCVIAYLMVTFVCLYAETHKRRRNESGHIDCSCY